MTRPTVAAIVEGHGEFRAVRSLIERVAGEIHGRWDVDIAQPYRLDSGKMLTGDFLDRAARFQAARVTAAGGILLLRDGDDAPERCPVRLAETLHHRIHQVPCPLAVVVANPEYEAWFLASVESLRTHRAVRDDARAPDDPESRRNAKRLLEEQMVESYKETLFQPTFTALMDLDAARERSRSFRRFVKAVGLLIGV